VARHPLVLALLAPRIGGTPELPTVDQALVGDPVPDGAADHPAAIAREGLRLRARWVQELTARAAEELGHRLATVGVLAEEELVRWLTLDELRAALTTRRAPADLAARAGDVLLEPLPAAFRVAEDGTPMPTRGAGEGAGVGAGGGVGQGPVALGDDPPAGSVLVVGPLDPRLAPVIPRLAGLVAESGSPLSHLAILAREHRVPVVVGHGGARTAWAEGTVVRVDGGTGVVEVVEVVADPPRERTASAVEEVAP
jgi:pyruvate,water dikinase